MLKNYIYACGACSHTWEEARHTIYAHVPGDWPCPSCRKQDAANITYTEKPPPELPEGHIQAPAILDSYTVGDKGRRGPREFEKQVIDRIKKHHYGSGIGEV